MRWQEAICRWLGHSRDVITGLETDRLYRCWPFREVRCRRCKAVLERKGGVPR